MLVWALVIGFVVWGDVPTPGLLVGSAIVVASGLFLLWHESQRRRSERLASSEVPASHLPGGAGIKSAPASLGLTIKKA